MSCVSTKNLNGKMFNYKSYKRRLELIFDNDSLCRLRNKFFCEDIEEKYKEIVIHCKYVRNKDIIVVRNRNCSSDDCKFNLALFIPPQYSSNCLFLSDKKADISKIYFGSRFLSKNISKGLVPNIDIDTLRIIKNKIVLYKSDGKQSIGFIFR